MGCGLNKCHAARFYSAAKPRLKTNFRQNNDRPHFAMASRATTLLLSSLKGYEIGGSLGSYV